MKRVMILTLIVMMISTIAYAKRIDCEVEDVITEIMTEGVKTGGYTKESIVIVCDDVGLMKTGDKIKVALPKKRAAIEGC